MKTLLIGGHGTIGRAVAGHLADRHELIIAGRSAGDMLVDIADIASIRSMYERIPDIDAVICAAGTAKWDRFDTLEEEDYYIGLRSKLMGQVNLVRLGMSVVNDGGSFTLTTGILGERPVPMTTSAALVNGGIHSFVKAAALELERGLRINVVAPGLVEDAAEKLGHFFPGHTPVGMGEVAAAYASAVEGEMTGELIRVYG